jgi:hypothetical protein
MQKNKETNMIGNDNYVQNIRIAKQNITIIIKYNNII